MVQPKFSPGLGEIDGKMILTWNLDYNQIGFLPIPLFSQIIRGPKPYKEKKHGGEKGEPTRATCDQQH